MACWKVLLGITSVDFVSGATQTTNKKRSILDFFPHRTKENYASHVQAVKENPDLVHCYGVKKVCPLNRKN